MEIVNKKIEDLKPYENNPRINDGAVDAVAESIQQFGFKVPIVIDKNNVIVAGHTRLKASKKLGLKNVPCIVADDLTDDQVKAFRLVENKTNELATWDDDLLMQELENININMGDFGFDFGNFEIGNIAEEDNGYYGDERERTYASYNMDMFDPSDCSNKWEMPIIYNDHYIPKRLIELNSLNYEDNLRGGSAEDLGLHFFQDDYKLDRLWNNPDYYLDTLKNYDCVLSPMFSVYLDMALPVKIWNIYRSRQLGQYWQRNGIKVIPTLYWGYADTYDFCFDGIPKGSIVAISTISVKNRKTGIDDWFKDGLDEMIKRIQPTAILVYGGAINYDFGDIQVVNYSNESTERMKENCKKEKE